MLVRGVVGHEVDEDLEPSLMRAGNELIEVLQRSVFRIDVAIVGDVIAVVLLRRGIEGRDPS